METNIQIREVQVSYQPLKGKLFQIKNADSAFEYLSTAYDESTIGLYEEFMVLLLNRANRVIGCLKLSKGGLTGTVVDIRILYGTALKRWHRVLSLLTTILQTTWYHRKKIVN